MKITKIQPAVKTAGRWNIFVDNTYSFSLDESQLVSHRLKVGQELDEAELAALKDDSNFGKAYARALDLILRRLRSRQEVIDYARRKEWPPAITRRVIERLEARGYIDDSKFAESWVRSREAIKPSSRRKLERELFQKGVASSIVFAVLGEEASEHDELAMLRRIVAKKQSRYSDEQKFIAYLARQGFRFDDIKAVLSGS